MNRHLKILLILFMGGICSKGACQPKQVSLVTAQNDVISISYEIETKKNILSIHFTDDLISMSSEHSGKNKKNDYFKAVFFDRRGNLPLFRSKTNINPIQIPHALSYTPSENGFFFLQEHPTLTFDGSDMEEDSKIIIPVYLVCYIPQKEIYELAGNAELRISLNNTLSNSDYYDSVKRQELSAASTEDNQDEVIKCISMINILLEQQEELPFSEMLVCEIAKLSVWSEHKDITPSLKKRIQSTLSSCSSKKEELEQKESEKKENEKMERERIEEEKKNQEREQLLEDERRDKEAKEQKIWTIIIGIVCSIAFSAGNQTFQYFKNIKMQKKMMELQQNMLGFTQNETLPDITEIADKSGHLPDTANEKKPTDVEDLLSKTEKQIKRFTI